MRCGLVNSGGQRGTAASPSAALPRLPPLQVTLYQLGLDEQSSEEGGGGGGAEEGRGRCGEEKLGRMSFVDLAGSERAQRTGNVGVRLKCAPWGWQRQPLRGSCRRVVRIAWAVGVARPILRLPMHACAPS